MREHFGVMVSDAVSKNNLKLATGALHTSLSKYWRVGLPMCISHDAHRLVGWNLPVGIHLEPGLARLMAVSLIAENSDDSQHLEQAYRRRLYDRVQESAGGYEAQLRTLVGPALGGDEQLADLCTPALVGKGLARRCFPDLFVQEDKDGLVPLRSMEPIQPGLYRRGPLVVFAHPCFRRSLSRLNNLNGDLLSNLEMLAAESDVIVKVRLDSDAVGLADRCFDPIEMQYWRGPHFDDDLGRIPPGVTRYEADERQRFFSLVCRTEFWWHSKVNDLLQRREHIFEAEELRDRYTFGADEDLYGCRYVHSIIDETTNMIEHLDGAMREYADEALLERLDKDIAHAGRHTTYTKYWRVDGPLRLSTWKTLIYHHFRENALVGEYFGMTGECSGRVIVPLTRPLVSSAVPRAGAAAGVRVALSYHRPDGGPLEEDRCLGMLGFVLEGAEEMRFVDAEFLDFLKLAGRAGLQMSLPQDVKLLAFEEHYHMFPLIRHRSDTAANETLDLLRSFVALWQDPERVLSFSLSKVTEDMEVRLSLLGGCTALGHWLQRFKFPPQAAEECTVWIDRVSDYLNSTPPVHDEPPLETVIKADGLFFLPRVKIPPEWVARVTPTHNLELQLERIKEKDPDLGDLTAAGTIRGAFCGFILRGTCARCGDDYRTCQCSKYADDGVAEQVEDFELVSFYWTDRPV
jgi:hypothetical protein